MKNIISFRKITEMIAKILNKKHNFECTNCGYTLTISSPNKLPASAICCPKCGINYIRRIRFYNNLYDYIFIKHKIKF